MFTIRRGDDTVTKSMRIPRRMAQKVERLAEEYEVSFTDLVLQCLEYALDNMGPEGDKEQAMPSEIR